MDEGRILHVRAIGRKISKQELMIYFQSRKQSGDGDISSVDLREGDAVITFEESDVAKSVVRRAPHTLNGTKVEVSYRAFDEEFHAKDTSVNQTCVMIVRGLPQSTTLDTVLNYFENTRRPGGGAVEEVKIEGSVARVKFESSEVAQHVVKHDKQHILNGATLDVSLELLDDAESTSKTIKITGVAAKTTEDSISNYFENERRSGGGEVEAVDLRPEENVAFVTFKDVDAVKSVLQHGQHILDGATLSLMPSNTATDSLDKVRIQESRTIEVTGLAPKTTEDAILNFFENKRRTGGGEIERVNFIPDRGVAFITFVAAESARGVINKGSLVYDGVNLLITLKQPARKLPVDTRRLFVQGLSDKTTSDALQSYMEVVSGVDVLNAEFGNETCAIVTFNEDYDYKAVTKMISRKPLEGKIPVVEQLPVCHCVQVSGFSKETTTEDTVRYYFESPKNNGGDVSSVELNLKEGWALVYFEDPEVVSNVVARSHFLDGAKLDVSSHCSLLGKPQPVKDNIELMQNINVHGIKMKFILENCKADLSEILNNHDVQITWNEGINSVTVKPKDKASRDNYSFDKACEAIASFLAEFVESSMRVPPEAWNDVLDTFKKSKSLAQQKVRMNCIPEQHVFLFIGKKQDVEDVTKELEGMMEEINEKLRREASKVESTISFSYTRLQFLKHLETAQELESRHEEIEVTILLEEEKLQIRGPPETIHEASAAICEAVAK